MADPADLVRKHSTGSEPEPGGLYAGHFAESATSVVEALEVIVDSFDPDITWGPAYWVPRVDDSGATVMPQEGDKCVVGLAESEIEGTPEVWIIGWWPGG